jgi:hypothetical protein
MPAVLFFTGLIILAVNIGFWPALGIFLIVLALAS